MYAILLFILPSILLADGPVEPRSRTFRFTYAATVTGLAAKQTARIWIPIPKTTSDQQVELIEQELPGPSRLGAEPRFGNRVLYFEAQPSPKGELSCKLVFLVMRREVRAGLSQASSDDVKLFLKPDSKVPFEGKHLRLLDGKKLPAEPVAMTRALYEIVNAELRYSKEGTGWGQGDVNWVCDNKYGNCTDFHSLFIGLVRSQKMPGKFEVGFPLPEKRGSGVIAGYHCWAKVQIEGKGWIPVDISMANQNARLKDYCFGNLTEDRVTFSTGRDIDLVPKQDGPALNFFVYPHVEVGGKAWATEKIVKRFHYEDVTSK